MPLAEHIPHAPNLGWWLGLGIGFAVVVVVVAVVAAALMHASRLNEQLRDALRALDGARDGISALRRADDASASAAALATTARLARRAVSDVPHAGDPVSKPDDELPAREEAEPAADEPEEQTAGVSDEPAAAGDDGRSARPEQEPGADVRGRLTRGLRRLGWRR